VKAVRSFDPDGPSVQPSRHRCGVDDIDYSNIDHGLLECTICGRTWELHVKRDREGRQTYAAWWPYPCPRCNVAAPACIHYGRPRRSKPQ
jgi:hypothetical protein